MLDQDNSNGINPTFKLILIVLVILALIFGGAILLRNLSNNKTTDVKNTDVSTEDIHIIETSTTAPTVGLAEIEKNEYEKRISDLETINQDLTDQIDSLEKQIEELEKTKTVTPTQSSTEATTESSTSQNNTQTVDYSKQHIIGTHDVTVKVNSDYNDLITELIKNVQADPNSYPDLNNVDLSKTGTYAVLWYTDDKLQSYATCYVNVE